MRSSLNVIDASQGLMGEFIWKVKSKMNSHLTIMNSENISGVLKNLIGADELSFVEIPQIAFAKEYYLNLSFKFPEDYLPKNSHDNMANIMEFCTKFLDHFSSRICYGEIKSLRERLASLTEATSKEIEDLRKYKIVYEMMK